jgi:hypothetical protein
VPLLDEALLELREPDRQAVILHFMEGQTFQEVGSALGVGEDAARKRVNRCLDQLTNFFRRRGFAVPALAAGAPLFAVSSHAAPAGLAASATTAGLAAAHSVASTSTLTLIKGALKIMAWTKAKTAIVAVAAVIVATSTTTLVVHHQQRVLPKPHPVAPTETEFPEGSWTYAGYADPRSAFLSAIWSDSKGDLKTWLASLTPGERERQSQQFKRMAQQTGKSLAACFIIASAEGLNKADGCRILDQQVIADDQVVLHISFHGTLPGEKQETVNRMMKKSCNLKIAKMGR